MRGCQQGKRGGLLEALEPSEGVLSRCSGCIQLGEGVLVLGEVQLLCREDGLRAAGDAELCVSCLGPVLKDRLKGKANGFSQAKLCGKPHQCRGLYADGTKIGYTPRAPAHLAVRQVLAARRCPPALAGRE